MKELLERFDAKVHFTTVKHSRSQGVIERVHSALIEHLQLINIEEEIGLQQTMRRAVIAYNNTIHRITGCTPIEVVFGENHGGRAVSATESDAAVGIFFRIRRKVTQEIRDAVKKKIEQDKVKRTNRIKNRKGKKLVRIG